MAEFVGSHGGGSLMSMKSRAAFFRKRVRHLPEMLRPGRIVGRGVFVGLLFLAFFTTLLKFALLNMLHRIEPPGMSYLPYSAINVDGLKSNVVHVKNYAPPTPSHHKLLVRSRIYIACVLNIVDCSFFHVSCKPLLMFLFELCHSGF